MTKGTVYQDRIFRYEDAFSGREIVRLSDYRGHTNHLYFTNPCWLNDGRSMIITSDRGNQSDLHLYDLDTFTMTQITDLTPPEGVGSIAPRPSGSYSAANKKQYFWWQNNLHEVDPYTYEERVVYETPAGFQTGGPANTTADGKYVCEIQRQVDETLGKPQIGFAYSNFRQLFAEKPLTRVIRIEVATGALEVVHEDRCYMGHCNLSPVLPDILSFCHEGPWNLVDQRIWGLNIQTGETWKIRPQDGQNIAVGHEYWFDDGLHLGYHGRPRTGGGDHVFGVIRWDNGDHVEDHFPFHSTHFHSLDRNLIVGDGTPASVFTSSTQARPYIQLFSWDGERYVGPRVLAFHRSTFNDQHAHCHPRFTPDGKSVLYTSDLTHYSNMYLVEIGDLDNLPLLEEIEAQNQ